MERSRLGDLCLNPDDGALGPAPANASREVRGARQEHAGGLLAGEVAQVGREDPPVGMRQDVILEVGHIVPDEELFGNLIPALDPAAHDGI